MNSPLTKTDLIDLLSLNYLNACEEAVDWVEKQDEEFAEQIYLNCPDSNWWGYVFDALQNAETPLLSSDFYDMRLFWEFVSISSNDPQFLADITEAEKIRSKKLKDVAIWSAFKSRALRIKMLNLLPPWKVIEKSLIIFHDTMNYRMEGESCD